MMEGGGEERGRGRKEGENDDEGKRDDGRGWRMVRR